MKSACWKSCANSSPNWATSSHSCGQATGSHLDRDLGLGSLERVELLLRLEKIFGTRLDEQVLAGAETVQDLIVALSGANGAPALPGARSVEQDKNAVRTIGISFPGQAEGVVAAATFQDVLRHRGRADAARTHLIFYQDEGESGSLTFGELFEGAERVAADLAKRGIGRGDSRGVDVADVARFFSLIRGYPAGGRDPSADLPAVSSRPHCGIRGAASRRSYPTRARAC